MKAENNYKDKKPNLIRTFLDNLTRRIQILEHNQTNNQDRLGILENHENGSSNIEDLEKAQSRKTAAKIASYRRMNDGELRIELKQKYGLSVWSDNLINQIIRQRFTEEVSHY